MGIEAVKELNDTGKVVMVLQLDEARVDIRGNNPGWTTLEPVSAMAVPGSIDFGRYYALVIGNDDYRHLRKLKTAVDDADEVSNLLRELYAFETLDLRNATRTELVSALHEFRRTLGPNDNLLIYYAGHGQLDPETEEGYWLPVDARSDDPSEWVSNSTVSTMLKGVEAKHVLVVVDSCFAGTLTRSEPWVYQQPDYLEKMASKKARVVMTSGGLEPVLDAGGGGHSVFATQFLRALRENSGVLEAGSVFLMLRKAVMDNAHQTPEYGPIRFTGHDGGDFLFVARTNPTRD